MPPESTPAPVLPTFGGGPPLAETVLCGFEARHGLRIPAAYRAFLAKHNGGRPERDCFHVAARGASSRVVFFFGLETGSAPCHLGWVRELFSDRIPPGLLAIGTTERADKLCVAVATGEVVVWELQTGRPLALAPSFEAFLETLYRDAQSPTATSSVWRLRLSPDANRRRP